MNAGEYRVKILDGKPDGLKVRSVYDYITFIHSSIYGSLRRNSV